MYTKHGIGLLNLSREGYMRST